MRGKQIPRFARNGGSKNKALVGTAEEAPFPGFFLPIADG
jgi:hypothetical protein